MHWDLGWRRESSARSYVIHLLVHTKSYIRDNLATSMLVELVSCYKFWKLFDQRGKHSFRIFQLSQCTALSSSLFGADHFIWCDLNKACSVWLYVYIIFKISDNFQKWKIFFFGKNLPIIVTILLSCHFLSTVPNSENHNKEKSQQVCLCNEAHMYHKGFQLWHPVCISRNSLC